jgi:TolA-binding protein
MTSRLRAPALLVLILVGAGVAPVAGQSSADDQARALLEDGRAYWAKKQYKQALENFNTIVTGFANTSSIDKALLEIGRYYLEVEASPEKAREAFDHVARRYPQSEGAPGAYYYLGIMSLNAASSVAELDDAVAQFKRLQRLYPRSDWVPRALHATGIAHRKAGRLQDAVEAERRVALEHPTSDAAPAAQFQVGHCLALLGEPQKAMEEFQRVRNRYPDSPWAAAALDRNTALYRLYGGAKPVFTRDTSYAAPVGEALKDVRAILMTPERTLWIASDKVKSAVSVEADGKKGATFGAEDLRGLSWNAKTGIIVVARTSVRLGAKDVKTFAVPSDKPGTMKPLDKITAAIVTPGGSLLVADDDKARVYRYDAHDQLVGTFPDTREHDVTRMTLDGEGGIVLLDRAQKTVAVYDESGKLIRSVGPKGGGYELRKPADVAADAFRNLYVADEESGVLIFGPGGQLLASLTGEDLRKPKAITVDVDGSVLVYDDRGERVVRYR